MEGANGELDPRDEPEDDTVALAPDRIRWRVQAEVQAEVHAEHGFAMTLHHDAPP